MGDSHPSSILETVTKREAILGSLIEGVDDKRDIEDELNISRSTVNRAFCELTEMGMIQTHNGSFGLTLHGKLAYQQYQNLTGSYTHLSKAIELSANLPADTQLDMQLLGGGEVTLSKRQTPQGPFKQIKEAVRSADCVKGYSPVVLPSYVDFFHEQIMERNLTVELILEEQIISALTVTYAEQFTPVAASDNCALWQIDDELPFGLIIVDDKMVWLCVYRDGGGLRGTLANDSDSAVNWALNIFRQYRNAAHKITISGAPHAHSTS
ncbi:Predicted transcriptional regulator, contains HTH domain [Halogranum amylolyticum]|uniref:Predicted transcriptional regulator, contains HTH domain n=1 Tax=Halogranum amylolyticum TaxID=660520 RepID=A0A1H8U9Y7_9EURY|nr:hypothetical protein [Halogranum amylolyticum]SEP00050.1 Predicted transcriptional regulator, contains HTH domain [Halogranum amylolyticum]